MKDVKQTLIGTSVMFLFSMAFFPLYIPEFAKMLTFGGSVCWSIACFISSIVLGNSEYARNK